jgi:hypothetical integral membrane protein (TIGR02206 family)
MDFSNDVLKLFLADYPGSPFQWFGTAHILALVFYVLLNLFLARFNGAQESSRRSIRLTMALILCANEIAWHAWNIATGRWTIQTMLPLHLCSLLVWAGALMLITKNYAIYEFMYFLGIGGAIQALITPDLGMYGFPHFRFFQTFISHGLIITAAIYMTTVEGFRPTWRSFLRVAFWMNVYVLIIFFLNQAIGSNYLNINFKPSTPSLLDLLPPWPVYVLYMEAIGIATCLLLYLPFYIKDRRSARAGTAANPPAA